MFITAPAKWIQCHCPPRKEVWSVWLPCNGMSSCSNREYAAAVLGACVKVTASYCLQECRHGDCAVPTYVMLKIALSAAWGICSVVSLGGRGHASRVTRRACRCCWYPSSGPNDDWWLLGSVLCEVYLAAKWMLPKFHGKCRLWKNCMDFKIFGTKINLFNFHFPRIFTKCLVLT